MPDKALFATYLRRLTPQKTALQPDGTLTSSIGCALFDIYGTLFISGSGDIGISMKNAGSTARLRPLLDKYRIEQSPEQVLAQLRAAIDREHDQEKRRGIDFPEIVVEQIWQRVLSLSDQQAARAFALEYELISNPVYPMPGLGELLDVCRRNRIDMGIISNAQFYTPLLFEYFLGAAPIQLGFRPDLIFYSYRFGVAKPSPLLFDTAKTHLQKLNRTVDTTLYLGNDMLNDIYPAQRCGFVTALFAGDRRSLRLRKEDERCRGIKPDLVVTDLKQLADLLGGQ